MLGSVGLPELQIINNFISIEFLECKWAYTILLNSWLWLVNQIHPMHYVAVKLLNKIANLYGAFDCLKRVNYEEKWKLGST